MSDDIASAATEPLSLYVDLEEAQKPDLEVIARAALEFTSAIREAAHVIDPYISVRVELLDSTDGSLSLNTLIRAFRRDEKAPSKLTRKGLIAIAISAGMWFSKETAEWTYSKVLDHISGSSDSEHLVESDKNDIANKVVDIFDRKVARRHVEAVYHELEADEAVRGVGISRSRGERPKEIVPRSEFAQRSIGMEVSVPIDEVVKRTRRTHERVRLIRPVLEPGTRRWEFSGAEGRFGATVRDKIFIEDLLNGHIAVPMVAGIEMDIDLETEEERKDGAWVVGKREVVRVERIYPPLIQRDLPLASPRRQKTQKNDSEEEDDGR